MGRFSMILAAALLSVAAHSAQASDAARGKVLATAWCSSCHVTQSDGTSARDIALPFPAIAANPERTPDFLRGWLQTAHPPMPNFNLKTRDIEDVVSYIRSLAVKK